MKFKTLLIIGAVSLAPLITALGQVASTTSSNCVPAAAVPIYCQAATTNLISTQYTTNPIYQGRHIGIGMSFVGGASTNTGTVGFQFAIQTRNRGSITTTRPFTITSTANGTAAVVDWAVLPNYTLGPADSLVLLTITNAAVNWNGGFAGGSLIVSNIWVQQDTLSR